MRISSQLCLTISWLGVLVRAESNFRPSSENSDQRNIRRQDSGGDDKTAESRQRFSFEADAFEPLVPPDFQLELSRLKIPVAEDLPRRIEFSREESREENENGTEGENESEQDTIDDSAESDNEDNEEERRNSQEREDTREEEDNDERDSERSNEEGEEEEADDKKEEGPPEYEDYDSPKNTISYHYDESGSSEKPEKPKKKRPYVEYEVTEKIPHDTKTVRPNQRVYPLPPPCPGAPPPTYPTTEAPSTKKPQPPPGPTFPPFPKIFPESPLLSQHDFLDSYFPTSFMSSSNSFPKAKFQMPAPMRKHPLKRYTPGGKETQKIHRRVASPRVILRYRQPTALVIRKVQHGPPPDRVIIRKPLPPPVKEVHIHHHHDTPGQVLHIHKDDEEAALETARFKAKVEGQRHLSDSQFESATTGPFAEPPRNIRLSVRHSS